MDDRKPLAYYEAVPYLLVLESVERGGEWLRRAEHPEAARLRRRGALRRRGPRAAGAGAAPGAATAVGPRRLDPRPAAAAPATPTTLSPPRPAKEAPMLARDDNERVTRVGPRHPEWAARCAGTGCPRCSGGSCRSPTARPVRVKLLGEELVAFRDSRGPHRAPRRALPAPAGLALPRAHTRSAGCAACTTAGSFDADGQCVDMMNEPPELAFAAKIRPGPIRRWRRAASSGPISGPPAQRPPLPHFAWDPGRRPRTVTSSKVIQESNWLQGLEGGIDTSHVPILHRVLATGSARPGFNTGGSVRCAAEHPRSSSTSRTTATATPACGPLADGEIHVRAYHFILPFHQIRPAPHRLGDPRVLRGGRPHLGADG